MNNKIILKLVLSFSLIIILIMRIDGAEFLSTIAQARIPFLIFVYLTLIPGTLIRTYKWKLLLKVQGIYRPQYLKLWGLYFVGVFFSNFLPTEAGGDIFRGYEVGKISGQRSKAMVAVFMERITGFFAVILYAVLGVMLNRKIAAELKIDYFIAAFCLISILSVCLFLNRTFVRSIKTLFNFKIIQEFIEKIKIIYEVFYEYKKNKKDLMFSLLISLVFQLHAIWYSYALLKCINVNIPFIQFVLVIPIITIISILPVTINSLGLREGAFVYIFTFLGATISASLALAIMYRIGMIIPSILGGIIFVLNSDYREDKKQINVMQK